MVTGDSGGGPGPKLISFIWLWESGQVTRCGVHKIMQMAVSLFVSAAAWFVGLY